MTSYVTPENLPSNILLHCSGDSFKLALTEAHTTTHVATGPSSFIKPADMAAGFKLPSCVPSSSAPVDTSYCSQNHLCYDALYLLFSNRAGVTLYEQVRKQSLGTLIPSPYPATCRFTAARKVRCQDSSLLCSPGAPHGQASSGFPALAP